MASNVRPTSAGEKGEAFLLRARHMALDYLNGLGAQGWQISSHGGIAAYLPMGSYLLMRRRVDE